MGGLFGTLNSSAGALSAYETALDIAQNNVSNASTPGYAAQVANLQALPFETSSGLTGGVQAGPTQSTQDEYANQAVRAQESLQGNYTAQSTALSSIQSLFDVSGQTGIIGALNNLFQNFSAWSTTPSSTAAQQSVLTSAQELAQSFQSTASSLTQTSNSLDQQITSTVQQINSIGADIQKDNIAIQESTTPDPGLDANLHASLETLSGLVNTSVTFAPDGAATVLLGGQTPLVIGNQLSAIQANFSDTTGSTNPGATPDVELVDSSGNDITGQISQGTLGGLLSVRNGVLPSLLGDGQQQGALNQLAQQVADRVNQVLASATTAAGQPGGPLFDYNSASPTDIAQTLTLDPNITPATLAATDPGPPVVANGAALTLSNLGNSTNATDEIGGQTILGFLNGIATQVGQSASDAQTGEDLHTQLLTQAQAVQTQISGVSLNTEAAQVLELQQGYQAVEKMVSVIDELTSTLINMVT